MSHVSYTVKGEAQHLLLQSKEGTAEYGVQCSDVKAQVRIKIINNARRPHVKDLQESMKINLY